MKSLKIGRLAILGNVPADSDQIWCVLRDQAVMHITHVIGGVHLHVRTCKRADVPRFPYLGNGRTGFAEIWCAVREPLVRRFTKV